ncbi:peptide ABC transporter permease [Clostridium beijerinckii]|uniref:Peptide ABC transporter permease n=1 Tax=Clostridium beijerinckii TaxID=1520 RepID=A0A0B5QQA8_CLOBE|nr:ABC transporter permease [Clostridium beijerinckii]AJH00168.1 peptide ABC transporter permease [Clostridium beijerinckii]
MILHKERKALSRQSGKRESMTVITLSRMKKNKTAMAGLIILTFIVLVAIFSPFITPYNYTETDLLHTFGLPSLSHPFGTDELGRDILSRMIIGSRASLSIGFVSMAGACVFGIVMGSICGYFGGKVDTVIMRFMDILQALPPLILAIAICAALGPGLNNCILAITISNIPSFVRMTRASVLNIRRMEYLEAATAINCSTYRIIVKHILPNALSPLIVQLTMGVATSIISASAMSFIGLGVQPPNPEWGAMLSAGRSYIRNYPHMVTFSGVTIMITVLSLNMLGDGLRDALDPKLKN